MDVFKDGLEACSIISIRKFKGLETTETFKRHRDAGEELLGVDDDRLFTQKHLDCSLGQTQLGF